MWSRTVGALHFRLDAKKGGTGRTWRECWSMSANVEARQGIPDAKLASSFTRILSPRILRFLMRTSSSLTTSSWRSRAWCRMLCWNVLNGFQNTQKISRDSRACSRFFQVLLLTSTIDKGLLRALEQMAHWIHWIQRRNRSFQSLKSLSTIEVRLHKPQLKCGCPRLLAMLASLS